MSDVLIMFILFPIAGYITGAIPFGPVIASFHKMDLRKHGSGNVGATNVGRVFGRKWGYLCFLLDVAKGFVPVFFVGLFLDHSCFHISFAQQVSWLLVAFGCILGHVFSFWLKFKGGKGVATSLGVVLGIFPYFTWAGLTAFALWIFVTGLFRYVSLGSIIASLCFVPLLLIYNWFCYKLSPIEIIPFMGFSLIMSALIIYLHKGNVKRLLAGNENKIKLPFTKNKLKASK